MENNSVLIFITYQQRINISYFMAIIEFDRK